MTLNSQSPPTPKKENKKNSSPALPPQESAEFSSTAELFHSSRRHKSGTWTPVRLSVCALAPGSWCDHGVRRRCGRTAVILNHTAGLSQAPSTRRSLLCEDYHNLFSNPEMFRRLTSSSHRKSSDFCTWENWPIGKDKNGFIQ